MVGQSEKGAVQEPAGTPVHHQKARIAALRRRMLGNLRFRQFIAIACKKKVVRGGSHGVLALSFRTLWDTWKGAVRQVTLSGERRVRFFFVSALLISACFLSACARKVRVEIRSIAEREETQQARLMGQRCLVLPARQDVSPDDLQFREFSAQVSASLSQKGCTPAQDIEDADLAMMLDYGIGEPLIVEQHSYVTYRPWGRWSRGIPDYVPVTTTYIFTTCWLGLEARLVEKASPPSGGVSKGGASSGPKAEKGAKLGRQVWKIDAVHAGQRIDLRALFPWLLAAAKGYYGVDSGQSVLIKVDEEELVSDPLPAKNVASPSETDAP